MNERIKELAEQAEMAANKGDHVDVKIMMAKFAELLVRECAGVCRDDGRWFQEQDDKVEAGIAYALAYKIKEHFGVEE